MRSNSSSQNDSKRILKVLWLLVISQLIIIVLMEIFIGLGLATSINVEAWRYSIIGLIGFSTLVIPILARLRNKKLLIMSGETEEEVHTGFKKALEVSGMSIILVNSQNHVKWISKKMLNTLKEQGIKSIGNEITKIDKDFIKAYRSPGKEIVIDSKFNKIYEVTFSPQEMAYFCQDRTEFYSLEQKLIENEKVVASLSVESSIDKREALGFIKSIEDIVEKEITKTNAIYQREEGLTFSFIMNSNDLRVLENTNFNFVKEVKSLLDSNNMTPSITLSIMTGGNSFIDLKNLSFNNLTENRSFAKTRIIIDSALNRGVTVYELEGDNFNKIGKKTSVMPADEKEGISKDLESLRKENIEKLNSIQEERERLVTVGIASNSEVDNKVEDNSRIVEVPNKVELKKDGTLPDWLQEIRRKNTIGVDFLQEEKRDITISSTIINEIRSVKEVVIYTKDIKKPEVLAASILLSLIAKLLGKKFIAYSIVPPDFHHSVKSKINSLGGELFVNSLVDTYELKRKSLEYCLIVVLQTDSVSKDTFQNTKKKKYSYIGGKDSNGLGLLLSNIKKDISKIDINKEEIELLKYVGKKITPKKSVEFVSTIKTIENKLKSIENIKKEQESISEEKEDERKRLNQEKQKLEEARIMRERAKKENLPELEERMEDKAKTEEKRLISNEKILYHKAKIKSQSDEWNTMIENNSEIKVELLNNLLEIGGIGLDKKIYVSYIPQYISSTPKEVDEVVHELLEENVGMVVVYTKLYNNKNVGMIYSYDFLDALDVATKLGNANGSKVKATYELITGSFEIAKDEFLNTIKNFIGS